MTRATRFAAALVMWSAATAEARATHIVTSSPKTHTITLQIDAVPGLPGEVVEVGVRLLAGDAEVNTARLTLEYDKALIAVAPRNGRPNCAVNPDIEKDGTSFVFLPTQCDAAEGECTAMRTFVYTTGNVYPIPDGAELFTCRFSVAATAGAGPVAIRCVEPSAKDPDGTALDVVCADGSILIGTSPTPTDTTSATPTRTPTPTPNRCVGDCGRFGAVTIADLVRAVNIALGTAPLGDCTAADSNGDLSVAINELVAAVRNALNGCGRF